MKNHSQFIAHRSSHPETNLIENHSETLSRFNTNSSSSADPYSQNDLRKMAKDFEK
jgi:hypothetical protein